MNDLKSNSRRGFRPKVYIYSMLTLAAFFYVVGINFFVSLAGTIPTGIIAIPATLSYMVPSLTPFITVIYLVMNVPLFIIFWKKIPNRKYMLRTGYFLIVQALFGLLFLIDAIDNFLIDTTFDSTHRSEESIRELRWPIIVFASVGALSVGISLGYTWKMGGSSGGTDIIIYYYSVKYKKSIGSISKKISTVIVLISFIAVVIYENETRGTWIFTALGTIIFVVLSSKIIDVIYPKYSKVRLDIVSDNYDEINKVLNNVGFQHAWEVQSFRSGKSNIEKHKISTTILLLEYRTLIAIVKKIDPDAWISITNIASVVGNFNTNAVDQ